MRDALGVLQNSMNQAVKLLAEATRRLQGPRGSTRGCNRFPAFPLKDTDSGKGASLSLNLSRIWFVKRDIYATYSTLLAIYKNGIGMR